MTYGEQMQLWVREALGELGGAASIIEVARQIWLNHEHDLRELAKGGRTNVFGFVLRLAARLPFLFIAGRVYGPDLVGRFALAIVVVEFSAQLATLGLKRGLAQALSTTDRPHVHVVWDAMAVAFLASMVATGILIAVPETMYPNSEIMGFDRFLPCIIVAIAWTEVSLAALAYRHNVKATVTSRAVVEPWTVSIAAWAFAFVSHRDGLMFSYMLSMLAAMVAALVPFLRSYGLPQGWVPRPGPLFQLARRNMPLAGADAIEWGSRNVDRFILGLLFAPTIVGIYYMAQQVSSLPQKLKTSFEPIMGPVITTSLAQKDYPAVANQVRQVGFWIMAAQAGVALMGSIPGEAVMGVLGPQFVAGTAALGFLLWAEVLASTGTVCESALVYMARHRNLMVSIAMLGVQVVLSFALVFAMRGLGWPTNYQAAGPAIALMLSVTMASAIKAWMLRRMLGEPVTGWRWQMVAAAAVAIIIGTIATHGPEWAELIIGIPAILGSYLYVLWRFAFGPKDRKLFAKMPKADEEPTLPAEKSAAR